MAPHHRAGSSTSYSLDYIQPTFSMGWALCRISPAGHLMSHGPLGGMPLSVCYCNWLSLLIITGSFLKGWTSILSIHAEAWWADLEPIPERQSATSKDPSRCTAITVPCQAASVLLVNVVACPGTAVALPHHPVVACDALNQQMH
jgi:hypothetical protein